MPEPASLFIERLLQGASIAVFNQRFNNAQQLGISLNDLSGNGFRTVQQMFPGQHLVHQSPGQGRMGIYGLAGKRDLLGPTLPHRLLKQLGHSPTRVDTHPGVGIGKLRIFGGDDKIAVQGQLKSAGNGVAVHRTDDGLFAGAHEIRQVAAVPPRVEKILPADGTQVQTRTKRGSVAGDDGHPDVTSGRHRIQRVVKVDQQLLVDGVSPLGSVERNHRDLILHVKKHGWGQCFSPCRIDRGAKPAQAGATAGSMTKAATGVKDAISRRSGRCATSVHPSIAGDRCAWIPKH